MKKFSMRTHSQSSLQSCLRAVTLGFASKFGFDGTTTPRRCSRSSRGVATLSALFMSFSLCVPVALTTDAVFAGAVLAADDDYYAEDGPVQNPAELDKRSKSDKKHEDDILYGRDETNVQAPPADTKPRRKSGKGTPLQGGIKHEESSGALSGNAEDDGGDLQAGQGQFGRGNPLNGQADDGGGPLQGNAQDDGANLSTDDPDLDDQELQVEWDKWRNNFLYAVQSGVQERLNNPEDMNLRFDRRTGMMLPKFPLGTMAWFDCVITRDRQIKDLKIVNTSGFKGYDKAVLDSVLNLDGTRLLKFPKRSMRKFVRQDAGIKTATQGGRQYFNFGDVERYRQ